MKENVHKIGGYIYVTNDEEIKQNDYIFNIIQNQISTAYYLDIITENDKKIILTNDLHLTTVQQLTPQEESYLKGVDSCSVEDTAVSYKLIMPTEQPLQFTAMGENEIWNNYLKEFEKIKNKSSKDFYENEFTELKGYILAKQTLYTEIDMNNFAEFAVAKFNNSDKVTLIKEYFNEWFNLKKK